MFALTIHRDYACGRSGACCTSGWHIPVETSTCEALAIALRAGRLQVPVRRTSAAPSAAAPVEALLQREADLPDGCSAWLGLDDQGRCLYYEPGRGTCAIHRQLGGDGLPVSCRQFPRVSLIDARGTFVTLSHYCPTAARLLLRTDVGLGIEHAPPMAAAAGPLEGLEARDALPPLVRPGFLHDLASYDAWERGVVALLARDDLSPEQALAGIANAAEQIRRWQRADGPLATCVEWSLARHSEAPGAEDILLASDPAAATRLWTTARRAVPPGVTAPALPGDVDGAWERLAACNWPAFSAPVRHYLAARLFASWMAYQGQGLRTLVASLFVALGVLRVETARACATEGRPLDADRLVEAFRMADLLVVHLASPQALADRLLPVERSAGPPGSSIEWAG